MFDANQLWKQRLALFFDEMKRYTRYMLNDHIKFVLIFGLGAGLFYYQKVLKGLSADFPGVLIIAIVMALVLTRSPVMTFLKNPDLVFLLPLETKLRAYFTKSIVFSWMLQMYVLILLFAAFGPLYFHVSDSSAGTYLAYGLILIIVKGWNVLSNWYMQYFTDQKIRLAGEVFRYVLNALFVYLLLAQATWFWIAAIGLVMGAFLLYIDRTVRNRKGLKWEVLIEAETERMTLFYRIANMFTDVPGLNLKVKKRAWLNGLTKRIPFTTEGAYRYLYMKTFTRSGDYFGIFIRLWLIGGVLIAIIPNAYGRVAVALLFLYLTGFQLQTLWSHHKTKIWVDLYPIPATFRQESFLSVISILLNIQAVLFAVFAIAAGAIIHAGVILVAGIAFNTFFTKVYVRNRVTRD